MLWFGLILLVVAAILVLVARKSHSRIYHMKATETSRVGDLLKMVKEVGAAMPDGNALGFSDYVEIKGQFVTERPVVGRISGQPAAIVEVEVLHMFEEYRETRDSQNRVSGSWSRSSESMSRDRQEATFFIDDGTGRLRVKPDGKAELTKIREEFQPASALQSHAGGGNVIAFGGIQMQFGGSPSGFGGGGGNYHYGGQGYFNSNSRRTLGYRFVESALPLGRPSYALGEVLVTEDEGLVLRPPPKDDKKRPFILAAQTEENLIGGAEKKARILKVIAIVLAAGGSALVVGGIF